MGMVLDGIAPWTSARITIVVDYMMQVFNECTRHAQGEDPGHAAAQRGTANAVLEADVELASGYQRSGSAGDRRVVHT